MIGNFEDIVQYNKDNKAFEGSTHDNVTIETLCDIMTKDEVDEVQDSSRSSSDGDEKKQGFLQEFEEGLEKLSEDIRGTQLGFAGSKQK